MLTNFNPFNCSNQQPNLAIKTHLGNFAMLSHCWTRLLQVKLKALTLAEMQAFMQRRKDEEKAAQQEIKNISEELER